MNKNTIITIVKDLIGELNIIEEGQLIDEDASLCDEYGINSIIIIELVMKIEERFGIEFDDSELNHHQLDTVNKIVELIVNHEKSSN